MLLAALCLALASAETAHAQGCGYARTAAPAGARVGAAPLALGDSVMLGAARLLSRKGFEVDARCARNPAEGLALLRQRRRRGTLPEIVVIALGTNIATSSRDIGRMLRAVGRRRTLMLVTPFRQWQPFNTRPMRRAARAVAEAREADRLEQPRAPEPPVARGATARTCAPTAWRPTRGMLKRAAWSRQRGRFG